MLWAVLITYGLIGCSDRRFVTFPVGLVHQRFMDLRGVLYYIMLPHSGGEGRDILTVVALLCCCRKTFLVFLS